MSVKGATDKIRGLAHPTVAYPGTNSYGQTSGLIFSPLTVSIKHPNHKIKASQKMKS